MISPEKTPEKREVILEIDNKLHDLLTTQSNLQNRALSELVQEAVRDFVADQ